MAKTIIRAPRGSERPYFSSSRAAAQDESLSWEARGVLWYLLSKPDDWKVTIADLMQNCGRDKVYRIIKELREAGYLERERVRMEGGTFRWGDYVVHEVPTKSLHEPLPEKPEMVTHEEQSPFPEKPYPAEPYTVKPEILQNTESTDKNTVAENRDGEPDDPVVEDTSHRAVFGAVQEVWPDLDKARQGRITNQLRGQSHREADQEYDIKPPMNATEVRAFGRWYRDDGPAHLPTAPATIERWVRKFRVASTHQRYVRQAEALRNPSPPEPSAYELVMSSVLSAVEGAADGA